MLLITHMYETETAAEVDENLALSGLLEKYGDDAWKTIYDYDTEGEKYTNQPKKIVVHHTATESCDPARISRDHAGNPRKGTHGYNTSLFRLFPEGGMAPEMSEHSEVRYHFLIQADGKIDQTRYEDEVGRGTRVNNIDVIHIAFCGDFSKVPPTDAQYKEGGKLIGRLTNEFGQLPVVGHGQLEGEHTACPGEHFSFDTLAENTPKETQSPTPAPKVTGASVLKTKKEAQPSCPEKPGMKCLGWFDEITAYYSPVPNQGRYFSPGGRTQRTYTQEVAVNGDLVPANGMLYLEDHKYTHGACGYNLLGKKLWIDGWSDTYGVFTCVDRGSAIDHNDLDIWYGIGREALNRIDGKDDPEGKVVHPREAMVWLQLE